MWNPFRAKSAPSKKRGFKGGKVGRLVDSWTQRPTPIDIDLQKDGRRLIARARDLATNNDYAARFLGLCKTNVVGAKGIRLQSQVPGRAAGEIDTLAANAIEAAHTRWSRSCDITGRLRLIDVENLFLSSLITDGEGIIRHRQPDNGFGYAVQLLDPVALDHNLTRRTESGSQIVMGVELDRDRRPLQYWFLTDERDPQGGNIIDGRRHFPVPAAEIIHCFLPTRINQTRGVTSFASTLLRAWNIDGFEESVIVSHRIASSTMGFFTRNEQGEGFTGDDENADGELEVDLDPGTFFNLPQGVDVTTFKGDQPTGYSDFVGQQLRGMSAGLNISYHSLANDLSGVNYSSARIGLIEDREFWRAMQDFLIDHLRRPIFERFIDSALVYDAIKIGNTPLRASDRDRYVAANFVGRRWAWVDPLKEAQATKEQIAMRTRSISDIIRDGGGDPRTVWQEIADEREILASLGISLDQTAQTEPVKDEDALL